SDERVRQMARLLGTKARRGISAEQIEADDKALEMLQTKQRTELESQLEATRGDPVDKPLEAIIQRLAEQLSAERKQLIVDKKTNRRRTFVAGTAATAL